LYLIFDTVVNLLHVPNFKKFNSIFATVGTEDDGVQILRRGGMILQAVKAAGRGVGGELLEPVAQIG
jgi:hypothetical protein